MRILFLSRWYPYPANNGSKLRIFNLLKGLSQYHEVTLLSFAESSEISSGIEKPPLKLKEILVVPRKAFDPDSPRARFGFLSATPRSFIDTFSPELAGSIGEILSAQKFDLIIASQIDMAAYGKYFQGLAALFEESEVGVLYEQYQKATSPSQQFRYWLTWSKHKRYLASRLKYFQAATVVSQKERQILSQAVPKHPAIEVIPNGIDFESYRNNNQIRQPNTMIFAGAFSYHPNYEAMAWFVSNVFHLIRNKIPAARLTITGNHLGLPLSSSEHINLTGFVDDVHPLIAQSACSVVPILSGGGTRLKILEAIALGTPVITTTKGAEGLDLLPGEDIFVADSAPEFADAVVTVLTDPEAGCRLADNALQKVQEKYEWSRILPQFLDLVQKVGQAA